MTAEKIEVACKLEHLSPTLSNVNVLYINRKDRLGEGITILLNKGIACPPSFRINARLRTTAINLLVHNNYIKLIHLLQVNRE